MNVKMYQHKLNLKSEWILSHRIPLQILRELMYNSSGNIAYFRSGIDEIDFLMHYRFFQEFSCVLGLEVRSEFYSLH